MGAATTLPMAALAKYTASPSAIAGGQAIKSEAQAAAAKDSPGIMDLVGKLLGPKIGLLSKLAPKGSPGDLSPNPFAIANDQPQLRYNDPRPTLGPLRGEASPPEPPPQPPTIDSLVAGLKSKQGISPPANVSVGTAANIPGLANNAPEASTGLTLPNSPMGTFNGTADMGDPLKAVLQRQQSLAALQDRSTTPFDQSVTPTPSKAFGNVATLPGGARLVQARSGTPTASASPGTNTTLTPKAPPLPPPPPNGGLTGLEPHDAAAANLAKLVGGDPIQLNPAATVASGPRLDPATAPRPSANSANPVLFKHLADLPGVDPKLIEMLSSKEIGWRPNDALSPQDIKSIMELNKNLKGGSVFGTGPGTAK